MIDFQRTASANKPKLYECPIVAATADTLKQYGILIDHFEDLPEHSGKERDSSVFNYWWKGNLFYCENETTGKLLQSGTSMLNDVDGSPLNRDMLYMWEAFSLDAHQLFYPLRGEDYILPLAQGKSVRPEDFTAFYVTGGMGVYLHHSVWCNGIIPLTERASFYHQIDGTDTTIGLNFSKELKSLFVVPLQKIKKQFHW